MNYKSKTFLLLTTVTTVSLHILNKVQYSLSTKNNLLSEKDGFYYEWRFGKIFYTKEKGHLYYLFMIYVLVVANMNLRKFQIN